MGVPLSAIAAPAPDMLQICNTCLLFSGPTAFTGVALDTRRGFCA
jgi:hypothetical protein